MPALAPRILVDVIIDAFQQSGCAAAYLSDSNRTHPRKFLIHHDNENLNVWIYIWTITHGGRVTLPDEYRIQLTSVRSPLVLNSSGYTALLGYYPDLGIFGGFDLNRHRTFTIGSPSVQINISAINDALQNGFGFSTKDNREIAIGIRPEQLVNYIINTRNLHRLGPNTRILNLLKKATETEVLNNADIRGLSAQRKKLIKNVNHFSRNANFRRKVLNAYENRCAITRMQLKLIEAAHILPVSVKESSDHVTNGIALTPTMHKAFDNSLIFIDEKYKIRMNEYKEKELIDAGLDGRITQIKAFMDKRIHLPSDHAQRPNITYIRKANKYRRIPDYF